MEIAGSESAKPGLERLPDHSTVLYEEEQAEYRIDSQGNGGGDVEYDQMQRPSDEEHGKE